MKAHALKLLLLILWFGLAPSLRAQNGSFIWASCAVAPSANTTSSGNAICTDTAGNVIIAGSYANSTIAFGSTTLTGYGNMDVYITKYDPLGNVLWAKKIGGVNSEFAPAVAADKSGNIIVAGSFNSATVNFGFTAPPVSLSNSAGGTYFDFYLAKYDPNGNLLWAQNANCTGNDGARSVTTDGAGNIYMSGDFSGNISFGSTTLNNANAPAGTNDAMLVKYDASGSFQWAAGIGNNGWETSSAVRADTSGNVYITGSFTSDSIIIGSTNLFYTNGGLFLAKYDTNGNPVWANNFGGESTSLSIDPGGNIFMTGNFNSFVMNFGSIALTNSAPTLQDIFLVKFDPAGNVYWALSAGGSSSDKCFSSSADRDGNVYIVGTFWNDIDFGAITLTDTMASYPMFIAKYGPDGYLHCIKPILTGGNQMTDGVAADPSGNAYLAATFYNNPLLLGPDTLTLTGAGSQVFVAKYTCCSQDAVQYASDTTITYGSSVTLTAPGGLDHIWSTGATTSSIVVSPAVTTDYCVLMADTGNCMTYDCIRVTVEGECSSPVFIANAFSPNNDGVNDYVRVQITNPECVSEFTIAIFDRWGVKVFESNDPGFHWDGAYHGRAMFSQVLTYFIRTKTIDGQENLVKGNISLVL